MAGTRKLPITEDVADMFRAIIEDRPKPKVEKIPNITPHVCRHTYCSNQAKAGMNPKTLQYLMGHSDISVTMNVYTHIGLEDAEKELRQMEEFKKAQEAIEPKTERLTSQKVFKVV